MTVASKTASTATPKTKEKRYSFGPVWTAAVAAGKVTDQGKLVAHAVKLKAGRKYDLSKLKFETLLAKVQAALAAQATPEGEKVEDATPVAEADQS